jgi:uncharacterized membrane protein
MVYPPGIHLRRIDCCSPFVEVPFSQVSGEFLIIRVPESAYQKNHTSGLWQQLGASKPPPMLDFPGLAAVMAGTLGVQTDIDGSIPVYRSGEPAMYDNTTCAHRCCVLGLVDRSVKDPLSAECAADWRQCVDVGFDRSSGNFPHCSRDLSADKCTVWVPCRNDGWILEPIVFLVVMFVFMVVCVAVRLWYCSDYAGCYDCLVWTIAWLCVVLSILGLVSSIEFIYWAETTEVNKEYISYQACVADCNSKSSDSAAVVFRFCEDPPFGTWSLWNEDSNPLSGLISKTGSCPSHYCSACASGSNKVDQMLELAWFLRIRSYVCWAVLWSIVADFSEKRLYWRVGCLIHTICFALCIVYTVKIDTVRGGRDQINGYAGAMGMPLPFLFDIVIACVVADFVMLLFMFLGFFEYNDRDERKNVSRSQSGNAGAMSGGGVQGVYAQITLPWGKIEPVYIRVRGS